VPLVQFLSFWTARACWLFGTIREIMRMAPEKRSGPGVPARAKSTLHLKDPSFGFDLRRIKSLEVSSGYEAVGPVTGSQRVYLRRILASLKEKLPERPSSCDACDDAWWVSTGSRSRSERESDPRQKRWIER
jgi:hypothetical protein